MFSDSVIASSCTWSYRTVSAYSNIVSMFSNMTRIHPKNGHQMPQVVILCGPHEHGTLGACCARILSSHGVQVTLLVPNSAAMPTSLSQEIELYKLIGNSLVHNVAGKFNLYQKQQLPFSWILVCGNNIKAPHTSFLSNSCSLLFYACLWSYLILAHLYAVPSPSRSH